MRNTKMNHLFHRRMLALLSFGLVFAALSGSGCGRHAKAKDQKQGQLVDYPSYPVQADHNAFTLAEGTENAVTYRTGTLLLLNPAFAPADLSKLIEISKSIRLARAAAVHSANLATSKMGSIQQEIVATRALIQQNQQAQSQKVSKEQRLASAETWFSTAILHDVAAPLQRKDLLDTFAGYCEAKIWQLAAQPYSASKRYLNRPTPLALCEKYYADKGFFSATAASCAKAQDNQGKYFVQCLWEEGVMKTALFQHHFADKKALFTDLLSDKKREDFRLILAAAMDNEEHKTDPLLVSPRLSGKIHTAIMSLKKLNNRCNVRLFEIKLGEMCTLFISSNPAVIPADGSTMATWDMPPAALVDLVENNKPAVDIVGGELVNLPRQFELPERTAGKIPYQYLILFFATRTETVPSESDLIFHTPAVQDNVQSAGVAAIASLPNQEKSVDDYRLALGDIYPKVSREDEAVITGLQHKIKNLENSLIATESEAGKYDKRVTDLLNEGIKAAKAPELAYAFINMGLQITKKSDIYTLEFWFGEDSRSAGDQKKRVKGCYNTFAQSNLTASACLDRPDYQIVANRFTYHPETGELLFAFPFDHADQLGFKAPTKGAKDGGVSDYFNHLPLSSFKGTSLEFQLFPNTVGGVVNILTGKVFVKPQGWQEGDPYLYEGVVDIFDNK